MVIACHSNFLGQTQGFGTYMQLFVCEIVPHVAVLLFMLFSGMLFFRNGMPTIAEYGRQLLKRVRTLLVPYLLWGTISFVVMACRGEVTFTFLHWLQHSFLLGISGRIHCSFACCVATAPAFCSAGSLFYDRRSLIIHRLVSKIRWGKRGAN